MFAVIKTGGKQYKIKPDDIINIERIKGEEGSEILLNEVLMHVNMEGNLSFENNISVKVQILSNFRGGKLIAFKKRRRHTYKKKKGHRQDLTKIKILSFEGKNEGKGEEKQIDGKKLINKSVEKKVEKKVESKENIDYKKNVNEGKKDVENVVKSVRSKKVEVVEKI